MMDLITAQTLAYNGAVMLLERLNEEYGTMEQAKEILLNELNATPEEMVELGIEEFETYKSEVEE